ncbi:AP-1-like transcription factor [Cytospora mali]|uniref:AP-1-like transcription factor n=1 Tax=Cytospora mali TaxID=578113 RepID=A0A194UVA2_CYTMA|nr:AP-1-like transcription factor [Valsa mali var. pyri (nom. inval.)]
MASTSNPLSHFILTPQQQSLLFAALNSNKQSTASPINGNLNMSPSSFTNSPVQNTDINGFQESPFIDYEYDLNGDTSFDFAFADGSHPKMIGDLPGSATSSKSDSDNNDIENSEKRSHPDDDDDEEGDAKRQETGDKVPKKPGRKPLTTEPTSKRKAQNRAAQRAFRERKEKHLKDLETKVLELEKASASANHENSRLRAQVDKMTAELSEYKKRFSAMVNTRTPNPSGPRPTFGHAVINNLNDVNFQFEFPKFGQLPGPLPSATNGVSMNGRTPNSQSPRNTRSPSGGTSPGQNGSRHGSTGSNLAKGLDAQTEEDLAKFSGVFSPPLTNNNVASVSRTSTDSHNSGAPTMTSSPSVSSHSNGCSSSSCGTSPEPSTQSPTGFKPVDTLMTIGEEKQPSFANTNQDYGHFANIDMNDLSFLTSTNNFQFDPQLFGSYREPQENILGNGIDDSFFNEAFDMDFTTPYFAPSPVTHKKDDQKDAQKSEDLIQKIDAAKNDDETELVQTNDGQLLTCNKIWEKLQDCPRVQSGDFDLDGLCSDLQKKAKCSGSGAVVDEHTFKNVMQKYLGKTDEEMEGDYCAIDLKSDQRVKQTSA